MDRIHDTTGDRGPKLLEAGRFEVPYYRHTDFPEPIDVVDLTPHQRNCLAAALALWITDAAIAAMRLQDELMRAREASRRVETR